MLSALLFFYVFEIGYIPTDQVQISEQLFEVNDFWYLDIQGIIMYDLRYFKPYIGGGMKTYAVRSSYNIFEMWPMRIDYTFIFGIKSGIVDIGFRHLCSHPVTPYVTHNRITSPVDGAFTEIYLRFSNK